MHFSASCGPNTIASRLSGGLPPGYPLRRPARHGGLTILEVRRVDAMYGPSIGMSPHAK